MSEEARNQSWHLDKRIPLAIIGTIAVQTVLAGVWVGSLQTQVTYMAGWIHDNSKVDSRLAVLENQNTQIQGTLTRIETYIATKDGKPPL